MKKILSLLLLFGFFCIQAQDSTTLPHEVTESIQKRIEYGLTPSIAIGIIDKNGPRYFSFGNISNDGNPVDEHTIYEIGSISKVFTGILLAYLDQKGTVKIDDPISKHLPAKVTVPTFAKQNIQLGHLSDHTSSFPRMPDNFSPADPSNPYADYSVDQMYEFVSNHELRREIGSEYEYSNLAQGLLGHILALKSGKSYEELMLEVIAKPLGMKETRISLDQMMKKNLAIGHNNGVAVSNWDIPTLAGAGGIRSSVHDMLIFLSANLGIKETSLHTAMQISHTARHHKGGMGVGLGWHIKDGAEGDVIWHNGGTGGYRTFAGFVRETGQGVVVLTNSTAGADDIGFHLLDSSSSLSEIKPSAAQQLRKWIESDGLESARKKYKEIEKNEAENYNFSESAMNQLGYAYLGEDKVLEAREVFLLNVESHPNSSNVYDSYGEALKKNGQKDQAIENYKKSLELNPGNANAINMLKEMDVEYEAEEISLKPEILQKYQGTYNLAPGFDIVITSEGQKIFGQATGQPRFEMFAKSETEFYLKVVDAQIEFHIDDQGVSESLTLFQGGQTIPGKKIQ